MSEYQYYEFQAIDRSLTEKEMNDLRQISSRARITTNRFINEYNYGDLRARPVFLLEKYFDAFCYVANWGTHWLGFRLPTHLVDSRVIDSYCTAESVAVQHKEKCLLLEFISESDDHEWEEGEGRLAAMISLRTDLLYGDFRCLYLAWLLAVQMGELDDDVREPIVPAGLNDLSGALASFADFLRIDPDLLAVATLASEGEGNRDQEKSLKNWLAHMVEAEKADLLCRFIGGKEPHLGLELRQRFLQETTEGNSVSDLEGQRTVGQLLAAAKSNYEKRMQRLAEEKARKQARREKEKAIAREKHLNALAGQEEKLWDKVNTHVAAKKQADYALAVQLLLDLAELAARTNNAAVFFDRLARLHKEHHRKYSFIKRLVRADLTS